MKNILSYLSLLALVAGFTACSEDLPLYDDPDNRLIFLYGREIEEEGIYEEPSFPYTSNFFIAYTFAYNDLETDEVYVTVKSIGHLSDRDRPILLEQLPTDGEDAVSGVHYVAFSDPFYTDKFVMPAGKTAVRLPIRVIRDPSLETKEVNLLLGVKDNGEFSPGFERRATLLLTITAELAKPANWSAQATFYFGTYGKVKHRLMIDALGGETVNEEYLRDLGFEESGYNSKFDDGYVVYMANVFTRYLNEENARRAAAGLGPLTEEDNTIVSFTTR